MFEVNHYNFHLLFSFQCENHAFKGKKKKKEKKEKKK